MKHGKKPTVEQRKLITAKGLKWEDWLVTKNLPSSIIITHRHGNAVRVIEKP